MNRTTSGVILPPGGELAVQRGRDVSQRLRDMVLEHQARGDTVLEVRVSSDIAGYMRAFFAAVFREFDNILPPTVCGVPFAEGGTGGKDFVIHTRKRGHVEL